MTAAKGDHWFRAQGPAFAVALLVLVIAGGTAGYMVTDARAPWDAFYMTVLALTTVESPSHLSRSGQAFTVVLLLGGVGAALYTFTLLATGDGADHDYSGVGPWPIARLSRRICGRITA